MSAGKIRVYIESCHVGISPLEEEHDAPDDWADLTSEQQEQVLREYYETAAESFIEGGVEYIPPGGAA